MSYEIDWASTWAGVSAVAASLTLLVASATAFAALRQLRQNRELNEDQARPYVVAMLEESEASGQFLDFVIRNVGKTAARNVRTHVDPPFVRAGRDSSYPFMETNFVQNAISTMPPQFEFRTLFEDIREHMAEAGRKSTYEVTLNYEDRNGRALSDSFVLDIEASKGALKVDVHNVHHVAKTLRAWAKKNGVQSF
jgi:hypothetical protein